jgi:hypothetical protein
MIPIVLVDIAKAMVAKSAETTSIVLTGKPANTVYVRSSAMEMMNVTVDSAWKMSAVRAAKTRIVPTGKSVKTACVCKAAMWMLIAGMDSAGTTLA